MRHSVFWHKLNNTVKQINELNETIDEEENWNRSKAFKGLRYGFDDGLGRTQFSYFVKGNWRISLILRIKFNNVGSRSATTDL